MLRGQNSTAPNIPDYIPHLFSCSSKVGDPDAPSSGITKQAGKLFGRLISKHSDKGLPPPLCLPVRRLVIAQHYAFPRKPSPRHVFFQVLVSLRNTHIQIHDVILKFTSEWVQITYYLLHGAHCATNVGAIFTPNSVCLFLLLWQELYFNKLCENIYLQIW